jgi:hypothetical protein
MRSGVVIEKGTKAAISVTFSACRERTISKLQTNFGRGNTLKRVFQQPLLFQL